MTDETNTTGRWTVDEDGDLVFLNPGHCSHRDFVALADGEECCFDSRESFDALVALVRAAESAPTAPADDLPPGVERIAAERRRQIEAEGWTPEHDAEHVGWELSRAAKCYIEAADYASANSRVLRPTPATWPWDVSAWRPTTDPVRMLAKAGALIAAEIDRLVRPVTPPEPETEWVPLWDLVDHKLPGCDWEVFGFRYERGGFFVAENYEQTHTRQFTIRADGMVEVQR